jgi:hypothetical protein
MVVRISTGKSIQGVIRYNESKRDQSVAKLIGSQGFSKGVEDLSSNQLAKRFEGLTSLNWRTNTNAVHISLNFSPEEKLSEEQLIAISKDYLLKIGFGNQPCLIYQHQDAGHPHVHLVTVNIDREGKRIETHNLGKTKSEKARKEIEKDYGLIPAEKQKRIGPSLQELGKLSYGKETSKSSINTVLNHVWNNYVFSSLGEYNAILSGFGVTAYRGEKDSMRYQRGGLVYHTLGEDGKRMGVPIKASSFYLKPTLKKLESKFSRDLSKKKELSREVEARVSRILSGSKTLEEYGEKLKKSGIKLVLNRTKQGQIYGVTYVDHLHRVGIKGSDLGKDYGANALASRFGLESAASNKQEKEIEHLNREGKLSENEVLSERPLEMGVVSFQFSDSPYQGPVPGKRKKKKKRGDKSTES